MPTTLAFRHVAFEDLGFLAGILAERGHRLTYVDTPTADLATIDPLADDLMVVLGGPLGVYETEDYPFLEPEIALIERRVAADRPTLGICLGAQLLARALGAAVVPGPAKEIGWAPLRLSEDGLRSPLRHLAPESTEVLHWHGDLLELPDGCTQLASTEACPNQAFARGGTILGLQFHAEAAGRELERWFVGHTLEIRTTPGISVPSLRAASERWSATMQAQGRLCFAEWLEPLRL